MDDSDDDSTAGLPFTIVAPVITSPSAATTAAPRSSSANHAELIALAAALSLPSVTPKTITNASPTNTSSPLSSTEPVAIGARSVSAPGTASLEPVSIGNRTTSATTTPGGTASHRVSPSIALSVPTSQPARLSAAGPSTPRVGYHQRYRILRSDEYNDIVCMMICMIARSKRS